MSEPTDPTNQNMTDSEDLSREELLDRVETLEAQLEAGGESRYSRRSVISAAATVAGLGALGVAQTGVVAAAPSGTFPEGSEDPLLKIRGDRVRLVPRTSDPATPDDGTLWYRGDL